jgi:hypothetical protein
MYSIDYKYVYFTVSHTVTGLEIYIYICDLVMRTGLQLHKIIQFDVWHYFVLSVLTNETCTLSNMKFISRQNLLPSFK